MLEGRGLRPGTRIQIWNVLPFYSTTFPLKSEMRGKSTEMVYSRNICGLVFSFQSRLNIVDFSPTLSAMCVRVPNHSAAWSHLWARKLCACAIFAALDIIVRLRFSKQDFERISHVSREKMNENASHFI